MGILDDAIREHLDLKRKHGARDADIREIEDQAFGSTDRPDPFAAGELFSGVSPAGTAEAEPDQDLGGGEEPTRLVEPEALLPSEPSTEVSEAGTPGEPISPPEGLDQIPGQTELPGQDEIPGQERLDDPLEGYQPSTEPEPEGYSPSTEPEAETPEPSESLEDLIAEEEPFPEDSAAPPAAPHEDLSPPPEVAKPPPPAEPPPADPADPDAPVREESDRPLTPEPESTVPDPPPPPPDTGPEPPGRARGRVDIPTEEHPPPGQTGDLPPVSLPESEHEPDHLEPTGTAPPVEEEPFADQQPPGDSGGPALYDFETDEDSLVESPASEPDDDFEALGPAEEEAPYLDEEEPYAEEPPSGTEPPAGAEPPAEEPKTEVRPALEDEEAYEGGAADPEEAWEEEEAEEGLWFEKGPPKDFDFDD